MKLLLFNLKDKIKLWFQSLFYHIFLKSKSYLCCARLPQRFWILKKGTQHELPRTPSCEEKKVCRVQWWWGKINSDLCPKACGLVFFSAAATIHFDGSQHVTFSNPGNGVSEAEILTFRFRTSQNQGLLVMSRDDTSADRLQLFLGNFLRRHFCQTVL